jgi:WD40 repeat protein
MALSRRGERLAIQTRQDADGLLLVDLAKLIRDRIPRGKPAGEIEVKTISRRLRSVPGAARDRAVTLAFLGNDGTLAVVQDNRLAFLDTQSGQRIATPLLRGDIRLVSVSPRATVLVIVTSGKLYLYSSPSVRKEYPCSSVAGRGVVSPGAALLAYYVSSETSPSAGDDSSRLRLWDIRSRGPSVSLRVLSRITALAFSLQGQLAVANQEGKIQLWNAARAALVSEQSTKGEPISAVAYSPDSRHVLTASNEAIAVWDAGNGEIIAVASPGQKGISHLAFTPDGRWLLSLAADGTLKVWRITIGTAGKAAPPKPRDPEAGKKLEVANMYLQNNQIQLAKSKLQQIKRDYPATAEADEASRLIEKLTAPATRPVATQPGKTKAGKGSGS